MKTKSIKYDRAVDLMRSGSRLCKMHANGGSEHFMVPGGRITDAVAARIKEHPLICSGQDGLFPGLNQTWKLRA
jgi:hypothetical protein